MRHTRRPHHSVSSFRFHLFIILLLAITACGLRLWLFSGFVLGDDPVYASYVSQIVHGSYPLIGTHAVFACRPIPLYAIALSIHVFGWFEWSFVLPILVASLLNTALIYIIGNTLANPLAGILAAFAYITFPLDVVHATTLTNDILLSTFLWGGCFFLLLAYRRYASAQGMISGRGYLLLSFLSGVIVGAAVAIKINALTAPVVLIVPFVVLRWKGAKHDLFKLLAAWVSGWFIVNAFLCFFLYYHSGDFLAHYHTEIRFNQDYNPSGYIPGRENLIRFLLYYPTRIAGIVQDGYQGTQFWSYGGFFLCFFLCLPLTLSCHFRALRLPAFFALAYLLIMQFMPLTIFPEYIPIHRLPRFLHLASIPAALVIGMAFMGLWNIKHPIITIVTGMIFLTLISSSVYWAYIKASFYRDCAQDRRWAWKIVQDTVMQYIITDQDMRNYLLFRSGFHPPFQIDSPPQLPRQMTHDALVIAGGARWPDLSPEIPYHWHENRERPDFQLLFEAPVALKAWRLSLPRIYSVTGTPKIVEPVVEDVLPASQFKTSVSGMRQIAALDVGNPASEKLFEYHIRKASWSGTRRFAYPDDVVCEDDGRAYLGEETLTLPSVTPKQPITIVKRLDPTVLKQSVDVYFNDSLIGIWEVGQEGIPSYWHERTFIIPAEVVTDVRGTFRFSYRHSQFDVNSFYYWFLQPEE